MNPSETSAEPRIGPDRRRWAVAASVVLLAIGGYAMYRSWGVWGVFVTCSVLTLAGACAPGFLLLPRSEATRRLLQRLAISAFLLMITGWGLVALLNPGYAIGWSMSGKSGHRVEISDETEALWIGMTALALGLTLGVASIRHAVRSYPLEVRGRWQPLGIPLGTTSRKPSARNALQERPPSRRLRRAGARQARRR